MNAKLYQEYVRCMNKALPKIAYSFSVPEYLLEEYCMNAYPQFEKNWDGSKSCLATYAGRIFRNIAIDMTKAAQPVEFNEAEYCQYISQERTSILASAIESLSESSKMIVNSVLTGSAPIKQVRRHGGKEKIRIKEWLISKGWTAKKIESCFTEIGRMLKEVEA